MKHSNDITERYSYVEEGKKMDVEKLPKKLQFAKYTGKKIKISVMFIEDCIEMNLQ